MMHNRVLMDYVLAIIFILAPCIVAAQSTASTIQQIRNQYPEVLKKVEQIEKGGEQGRFDELVCNEFFGGIQPQSVNFSQQY